ncbi:Fic family protein [Rhodohalobacter sulfatireducens]|uniref:Fic family protein n=1 Tax=Rhodohalobacter sulfatireducens TaxID=2911366 RepID=A0ABS9K8P4_9BACT|nr:Fic family protein [Rhodohalobacter sulfatireducens]MCG2587182.1 Fic family protein [Rhodohalobacter sulfatireducens]
MSDEPKEWEWSPLPPKIELETPEVLKKALEAQQYLSELKGISQTIPNQGILLNTLPIQEARDSSEIENIVTTSDALYKADVEKEKKIDQTTKEVQRYAFALHEGLSRVLKDGLITIKDILAIQERLEDNDAGLRSLPGTTLTNPSTGEIVFKPPQHKEIIIDALKNLETYINDDSISNVHPLIKMAVIHFQFESIHPFYDGNGRTGRIINMLYLVQKNLLDIPVLYLSRYIVQTKPQYYELLQKVRTDQDWESWILYMLEGVAQTSKGTIADIINIREQMMQAKHQIRKQFSFYSQDLINHIFRHPYTKINHLKEDLRISRPTATKYLDELSGAGFLDKVKQGRDNYYINSKLLVVLTGEK